MIFSSQPSSPEKGNPYNPIEAGIHLHRLFPSWASSMGGSELEVRELLEPQNYVENR